MKGLDPCRKIIDNSLIWGNLRQGIDLWYYQICLTLSPSIICDYIRKHLDQHQLLCDTQYGFWEKSSTIYMLS